MAKTYISEQSQMMLSPISPDLNRIHPYARERYCRFMKELNDEVPIGQLKDEDFTAQELADLLKYVKGVTEWLGKCREDAGAASLAVYPYSINYDMNNLKKLLKMAFERKMEKARLEMEKQKREAALQKSPLR